MSTTAELNALKAEIKRKINILSMVVEKEEWDKVDQTRIELNILCSTFRFAKEQNDSE